MKAGAVAFMGTTVTLAWCLVHYWFSVCWLLGQYLKKNVNKEPGIIPLNWCAVAHLCGRSNKRTKQTLWLIAFLIGSDQSLSLLLKQSWKNSKGQQRMHNWHFLYIVNMRVILSMEELILFLLFYIQWTQLLWIWKIFCNLPELVAVRIILGLPSSQAISEPSLAHPSHWVLPGSLPPASHAEFKTEI